MAGKETHRKSAIKAQMTSSSDVDRGWCWVILVAAFMAHGITSGFIYSLGVYFIALQETYGGSKTSIAWIPSIICGGVYLSGPVASTLVNKLGCQLVGTVGAGLAFLGFFLSMFAPNIYVLYVTLGIITGAGIGLIYLPTVLSVTIYFKKYRGVACSIAFSGCGVGGFIFSPLSEYLLQEYGLRGTFLLCSGIMLNCIPCCLMYRTLNQTECFRSEVEVNAMKYVDSREGNTSNNCEDKHYLDMTVDIQTEEQFVTLLNSNIDWTDTGRDDKFANATTGLKINGTENEFVELLSDKSTAHMEKEILVDVKDRRITEITFSKEDSFLTRYIKLLKLPKVLLFNVSQFLFIGTCYIPMIFIPDKAKMHKIKEEDSAWVASAIGMGGICGRILLGFVADRPFVNKNTLFKIVLISCGVSTALCPWLNTLWSLLVYAAIYGTANGSTVSLTSVILLDTVGISCITDAIGLHYLIGGLGGLLGPPFVGLLYDLTGTYTATFLFAGGAMATAAMLVIGL